MICFNGNVLIEFSGDKVMITTDQGTMLIEGNISPSHNPTFLINNHYTKFDKFDFDHRNHSFISSDSLIDT